MKAKALIDLTRTQRKSVRSLFSLHITHFHIVETWLDLFFRHFIIVVVVIVWSEQRKLLNEKEAKA